MQAHDPMVGGRPFSCHCYWMTLCSNTLVAGILHPISSRPPVDRDSYCDHSVPQLLLLCRPGVMASDGVAPPPATLAQVPPEDDMDDLDGTSIPCPSFLIRS